MHIYIKRNLHDPVQDVIEVTPVDDIVLVEVSVLLMNMIYIYIYIYIYMMMIYVMNITIFLGSVSSL